MIPASPASPRRSALFAAASVLALAVWFLVRDPVASLLAVNTLRLCVAAAAIALPLGSLVAVLLVRTNLWGRGLFLTLLTSLLFVPLYVQVAGWDAGIGGPGWFNSYLGRAANEPVLSRFATTVLIHGLAAIPWVTLIVGLGLTFVEPEIEEAALTEAGPARVFWRITLRRALGFVAVAGLWVIINTAGEIVVTDIYQVRTYAEEVFNGFALNNELSEAPLRVLPGMVIVSWLVIAAMIGVDGLLPRAGAPSERPPRPFELRAWQWPAIVFVFAVLLLVVGVPLYNLVRTAGVQTTETETGRTHIWQFKTFVQMVALSPVREARAFAWSLAIGGLSATAAVALAIPLTWLAVRRRLFRVLAILLAALGLAVPGPIVGLGIIKLFSWSDAPWLVNLYDHSLAAPCLAALVRCFPLVVLIGLHTFRSLSPEVLETAALEGASEWTQLWRVALPQRRAGLAVAWLVGFAASMSDVAALKLVMPPGVETVGELIFRLIHTGVTDQLAGTCLFTLGVFLVLALLVRCSAVRWPRLS